MFAVIVDKYRSEDRADVDALARRVFGAAWADASARRWDWQYRQNPNATAPEIWIARDGSSIVGQYATMPVRLRVAGQEIDASWGMDVMVAPERQRQGLGEVLFRTWDSHIGASLGLGLSTSSHRLFQKLHWPEVGPVPCLVKMLSPRAFARPGWPAPLNATISLVARPLLALTRAPAPTNVDVRHITGFDERFTKFWETVASKFTFAVRRDARYLQWKYIALPHLKYEIVAIERLGAIAGYAVYRHADESRGRVTALVDFLADPDDQPAIAALLWVVEQEARKAGSDKIRTFAMHAAFRSTMRSLRYAEVPSTIEFVAKVNAVPVGPDYYADTSAWHVTFGDSDQDR
jgi:GNAT superfamily N-acetyltransferase